MSESGLVADATSGSDNSTLGSVKDLFSTLGGLYIQSRAVEKANPQAFSQYAWGAASGNTNGAILQPYIQTQAQQQQQVNQQQMHGNILNSPIVLIGGLALVLFLVLRK